VEPAPAGQAGILLEAACCMAASGLAWSARLTDDKSHKIIILGKVYRDPSRNPIIHSNPLIKILMVRRTKLPCIAQISW
jgi:hypothetical protein